MKANSPAMNPPCSRSRPYQVRSGGKPIVTVCSRSYPVFFLAFGDNRKRLVRDRSLQLERYVHKSLKVLVGDAGIEPATPPV